MNNQKIHKAARIGGVRRKMPIKKTTIKEKELIFNKKLQNQFKKRLFPIDKVSVALFERDQDVVDFIENVDIKTIVDQKGAGIAYIVKGNVSSINKKNILSKNEVTENITDENETKSKVDQIDNKKSKIEEIIDEPKVIADKNDHEKVTEVENNHEKITEVKSDHEKVTEVKDDKSKVDIVKNDGVNELKTIIKENTEAGNGDIKKITNTKIIKDEKAEFKPKINEELSKDVSIKSDSMKDEKIDKDGDFNTIVEELVRRVIDEVD
ncbi:hypothetical protein DMUE_4978 [Dictyocoela muelleri]|nr:hypothetical protein DMUE_4978 [Dictyocoela muelleri]